MRQEFDLMKCEQDSLGLVEPAVKVALGKRAEALDLRIFVDDLLNFPPASFEPSGLDFAPYATGARRRGVFRFLDERLLIPKYRIIPVYAYNAGSEGGLEPFPRGLLNIDRLVIAHPVDFTQEELKKGGFSSWQDLVLGMKKDYPHPLPSHDSVMSYYSISYARFKFHPLEVTRYFDRRPELVFRPAP
ncbi:hypothetical protein JW826_00675 [Candidatus Woesearchaeota archaeon]|nr:hypothetical protein [Candidatus Woesearchaeota archaeon]